MHNLDVLERAGLVDFSVLLNFLIFYFFSYFFILLFFFYVILFLILFNFIAVTQNPRS